MARLVAGFLRRGSYVDWIELMRITEGDLHPARAASAGPNDLVGAVRAESDDAAHAGGARD